MDEYFQPAPVSGHLVSEVPGTGIPAQSPHVHEVHCETGPDIPSTMTPLKESPMGAATEEVVVTENVTDRITNNIFQQPKGNTMDTTALLPLMLGGNSGNTGAAVGGGLGAGLLGGVLGGALLGNRGGLLGGAAAVDGVAGGVTPAMLTAGLAAVTAGVQSTTLQQSIGDIKGAIPLAEGQVQLALSGVQNDINRAISGSQSDIMSQLTSQATAAALANQMTNQAIANATATIIATETAVKDSVAAYGVANLNATKDAQFATQVAISASTKEILAALNDQNTANLQRQLTVAETVGLENRLLAAQRDNSVTVTQTVNQQQLQSQQQQQQQQQTIELRNLFGLMAGQLNNIHQGIVQIGTGNAATPTNTQTNVR